jgi:hypothetical protein
MTTFGRLAEIEGLHEVLGEAKNSCPRPGRCARGHLLMSVDAEQLRDLAGEEDARQQHADQHADGEVVGVDHERTVASITMEDERGCTRRLLIEDHEKVPIETMIMIATSAGIGMIATRSPRPTTRISSMAPATKVDSRPRPPDFTLMIDWPIMAQPAMPPMKPVAVLASPGRRIPGCGSTRCRSDHRRWFWVIRISSRPTTATAME